MTETQPRLVLVYGNQWAFLSLLPDVSFALSLGEQAGVILLGVVVLFACWTTAIGLTSSCGNFFRDLTGGKLKYETVVVVVCVFSWVISNAGVSTIISVSAPLLMLVYPGVLALIVLAFFHKQIKNKNVYRFAAYAGILVSACEILAGYGLPTGFVAALPMASMGFAWILPSIIAGIIGNFVPCKD